MTFTPLKWHDLTPIGAVTWQPTTRGIRSFVDSGNATEAELATGVADKVSLANKRAGTTVNILLTCITEALRQGKGGIERFREFSDPEPRRRLKVTFRSNERQGLLSKLELPPDHGGTRRLIAITVGLQGKAVDFLNQDTE